MIGALVFCAILFSLVSLIIIWVDRKSTDNQLYIQVLEAKSQELVNLHSKLQQSLQLLEQVEKHIWRKQDFAFRDQIQVFLRNAREED